MPVDANASAELKGVHLSARTIPVPKSISPQAQAALAMDRPARPPSPPLDDKAAWRAYIAESNAGMSAMMKPAIDKLPARATLTHIAGVPVYVGEPDAIPERNRGRAIIHFHGGALVLLGGETVAQFAVAEAAATQCKVFAVDYRNPPDHPYPAALDDCVAVYRELLKTHSPDKLMISGVSGGGNLAVAAPLKIRDLGMKLPAAIGLLTPEIDLTESGDTFQTNRDIDVVLRGGLPIMNALYTNGHDPSDPYVSPLFGDFSKGFAPTFIQTGTRDIFLSNSVRLHRALLKAGVEAELHVWEAMPHAGFGGNTPEDLEVRAQLSKFVDKHLA